MSEQIIHFEAYELGSIRLTTGRTDPELVRFTARIVEIDAKLDLGGALGA